MQQSRRPFLDTRLFARKGNIEEFVIQVGGESDKSSEEDRSSSDIDCSISDSET